MSYANTSNMAKVLVVGGAGYVGSSNVAWLRDQGHFCWVVDNLATSRRRFALGDRFSLVSAGDHEAIEAILKKEKFDCVMHFAASTLVSESVANPSKYFENNVEQTRLLLDVLLSNGVKNLVFSSTCAVFGDPKGQAIHERLSRAPLSPYGESKVRAEALIQNLCKDRGLRAIVLRYFNASGTEPKIRTGEWHEPETHLIPNVLRAAATGQAVEVFGKDYATPDGTCIRDYVHVTDLARTHEAALQKLLALPTSPNGFFEDYNLGSESGHSVLEVIRECERVTGKKIPHQVRERRAGDADRLVADSSKAKRDLAFFIQHDLSSIVSTSWEWEKKRNIRRKAAFLDRDGTINFDPGYLKAPEEMRLLDGVGDALQALQKAGYLLIMVSNQSGVGRGLIEAGQIQRIHARLDELLAPWGVAIDDYALCFHKPEDHCDCRKPKPKLILDMAERWNIDLSQSIMIGDRDTDLMAGRAAGCARVGWIEHLVPGVAKAIGTPVDPVPAPELYDLHADSLLGITKSFLNL